MEDYVFFGQTWQWPPSEVDRLRWTQRKMMKQAYKDHMVNNRNNNSGG